MRLNGLGLHVFFAALVVACGAPPQPPPAIQDGGHPAVDAGEPPYDGPTLAAYNPNDLSILFPAPASEADALLRMSNATGQGERILLAEAVFDLLGDTDAGVPFLIEGPGRDALYDKLRVVSARIDPCFDVHQPTQGTACQRQVRLVAQAYLDGALTDASIHLFYELDDEAFVDLLLALSPVRLGAEHPATLGVHPSLEEHGLQSAAAETIRSALLEACQETRLFRFTFMATGRSGNNWFFHTLQRQPDGSFKAKKDELSHGGLTNFGTADDREPVPLMDPAFPDELLFTTSVASLSQVGFEAAVQKLLRLSNPRVVATGEGHCASCHAVDTTLKHALEVRGLAETPLVTEGFSSTPVPLTALHHGFDNLHAFSYFGPDVSISLRTRYETEKVVEFLSSTEFMGSLRPELRARLLE